MYVGRERWSVGLLQVLARVVSPGAYVLSEWNHLKYIVHPIFLCLCIEFHRLSEGQFCSYIEGHILSD